jgi:hypothetical protein
VDNRTARSVSSYLQTVPVTHEGERTDFVGRKDLFMLWRSCLAALVVGSCLACSANDDQPVEAGGSGSGGTIASGGDVGTGGGTTGGTGGGDTGGTGGDTGGTGGGDTGGAPAGGTGGDTGGTGGGTGGGDTGGTGAASGGTGGNTSPTGAYDDPVRMYQETLEWTHSEVVINDDCSLAQPPGDLITTTHQLTVLENGLLKVSIMPDWGGRILRILHKPSGKYLVNGARGPSEAFSYLMGHFYCDWLMLPGGIHMGFATAEHGKYWYRDWGLEVVESSDDLVTVSMSMRDTVDFAGRPNSPNSFGRYVATGVLAQVSVSLRRSLASVQMGIDVVNDTGTPAQEFEFWVSQSFEGYADSEVVAPMERVLLQDGWGGWMRPLEQSAGSNCDGDVCDYNALAYPMNWTGTGIIYAEPRLSDGWYGMLNGAESGNWGLMRFTDASADPFPGSPYGMKFWITDGVFASGGAGGLVELWTGITHRFFSTMTLPEGTISWTEQYFPVFGLERISEVSERGALQLDSSWEGGDLAVEAVFSGTRPDVEHRLTLSVRGAGGGAEVQSFEDESFIVDPAAPVRVQRSATLATGSYEVVAEVIDVQSGATVLTAVEPVPSG